VVSCGDGGSTPPPPPPPLVNTDDLYDAGWVVDGDTFTYTTSSITFDDNFQYGTSWQKKIPWASLLNTAINVNDVYELEIAFTVDRALDNKLQWVLINDDQSVDYWQELSAWKTVINGQDKDFDEENDEPPVFTSTDSVTYKGRTLATTAAPASQAKLALDTEAEDNTGGAPALTVTTFKITKLKWAGSDESEDGAPVVLFDLQEALASVTVGANTDSAIFSGGKWQNAGATNEIITSGSGKAIKTTTSADWQGFDLNDSGLNFAVGYKIEIAGTWEGTSGKQILLNLNHAGWKPLDGWNPALDNGDTFSHEFTLTAGDVADIATATPKAIRVRTNAAGAVFTVTKLIVTDK